MCMIGQENLMATVRQQIESGNFPAFSIFVGESGSGKRKFLSEVFKNNAVYFGVKVDDVRKLSEFALRMTNTVFILAEADNMSLAAQNALLKLVEECRQGNRFIITLTDINNVFETIKSRGAVYQMERYTPQQLLQYACVDDKQSEIISDICETPLDVDVLKSYGVDRFYQFIELVSDNVATVSGANAFKIGDRLAFKDTDTDKYDLRLFLRAFRRVCMNRYIKAYDNAEMYLEGITVSQKYLSQLRIKGVNKQSLFDMWLLDIRREWAKWI